MSIYSANRTGETGIGMIQANEAYTENDFGRILYEVQLNDMAFFEAVLKTDIEEVKALAEGTLLEAEVEEVNAKAKESFFKRMIETFKKFVAKIKGAIVSAIRNMEDKMLENKSLMKEYLYITRNAKWDGSINADMYTFMDIGGIINKFSDCCQKDNLADILDTMVGVRANNAKEYADIVTKNESQSITFTGESTNSLAGMVDKLFVVIKGIRSINDNLNSVIRNLEKMAKEDGDFDKDGLDAVHHTVSLLQQAITIVCKTQIAMAKSNVHTLHRVMKAIINDIKKDKK